MKALDDRIDVLNYRIDKLEKKMVIVALKKCGINGCIGNLVDDNIFYCNSHKMFNDKCIAILSGRYCGAYCDNSQGNQYCVNH